MPIGGRLLQENGSALLLEGQTGVLLREVNFDWGARIRALLPQPWFSAAAMASGPLGVNDRGNNGLLWALTQMVASGMAYTWSLLVYAKAQTRIATATDANLDQIALDLYGAKPGLALPRATGESDAAYSARIQARFPVIKSTGPGVAGALNRYFSAYSPAPGTPTVNVYDQQSNPIEANRYGVAPPKFVVNLTYTRSTGFFLDRTQPAARTASAYLDRGTYLVQRAALPLSRCFILDRTYLDRNSYLQDPNTGIGIEATNVTPADALIAATVAEFKAGGTKPIFNLAYHP